MAEFQGDRLVFLESFEFADASDRPIPPVWRGGFGRHEADDLIARLYLIEAGGMTARGYPDSVRQRFRLWETVAALPEPVSVLFREGDDGSAGLAAYVPDGESLPSYLSRGGVTSEEDLSGLLRGVIAWLDALVAVPRLLANVEVEDFLVYLRDGWAPSVTLSPAGAVLREEISLSDHRLATLWTERLEQLHVKHVPGRKGLAEKLGMSGSPFRALLKRLKSGPDRSLEDHFAELSSVLNLRSDGLSLPPGDGPLPRGPLATHLAVRAIESDRALYDKPGDFDGSRPDFRAFVIPSVSLDGSRPCLGFLMPPEPWFEDSLIDCLNRRLAHPFLKSHHHCLRIRSVYCDDRVTILRTDPSVGLPLPTLLSALGGISPGEALAVARKLHRALTQFESAGFDPELASPWQVEVHLEAGLPEAGWNSLLQTGLSKWPSWEVIIRCEKPAESVLPGVSNSLWDWMLQRLEMKFFPALSAWMLEWRRLQQGAEPVWNDPLSSDLRLASLFEAAAIHLDPRDPKQREKFLALLEEGLVGSSTLSGPAP